jgi:hypothetical protein
MRGWLPSICQRLECTSPVACCRPGRAAPFRCRRARAFSSGSASIPSTTLSCRRDAPLSGGVGNWHEPIMRQGPPASASAILRAISRNAGAGQPELIHAVAVRANMRSILVAMMKSFLCSPLIFLVRRETVALPRPKLYSDDGLQLPRVHQSPEQGKRGSPLRSGYSGRRAKLIGRTRRHVQTETLPENGTNFLLSRTRDKANQRFSSRSCVAASRCCAACKSRGSIVTISIEELCDCAGTKIIVEIRR